MLVVGMIGRAVRITGDRVVLVAGRPTSHQCRFCHKSYKNKPTLYSHISQYHRQDNRQRRFASASQAFYRLAESGPQQRLPPTKGYDEFNWNFDDAETPDLSIVE